jgi:hypothetical protein
MATNTTIPAHIHHGTLRSLPSHLQEAVLPYRGIRVGFTGTRRLHGGTLRATEIHAVHRQVQDWVDERKKDGGPITWVQGGCVGFDALAATIVYHTTKRAPVTNHIHTVLPADLRQVDESWPIWSDTYEYLPEGTSPLDRDWALVDLLAGYNHHLKQRTPVARLPALYAVALYPEEASLRSGTWATVRYARLMSAQVVSIPIYTYVIRPNGPPQPGLPPRR